MRLKIFLILILCNLIWSANPLFAKWLINESSPAQTAWLRYASALLAYLIAYIWVRVRTGQATALGGQRFFVAQASRKDWFLLALMGFLPFCYSPLLQLTGLGMSQVTDNAIIIAMEPLGIVFIGWLFLKEKVLPLQWASLAMAFLGFLLLSRLTPSELARGVSTQAWGNILMLASIAGEVGYTIAGRVLLRRHLSLPVFGSSLLFGVLLLSLAVPFVLMGMHWQPVWHLSARGWFGAIWLGALGTTATYLYWLLAMPKVGMAAIALTLFVQPIFGSIFGHLWMGDALEGGQLVGAAMILLAVAVQAWLEWRSAQRVPADT